MKGGIDKLADQLAQVVAANALMVFENLKYQMESPIERLLYVGMTEILPMQELDAMPLYTYETMHGDRAYHPEQTKRLAAPGTVLIQLQHREIDWLADFVISCPAISKKKVIIECDGHDFHERTKEQAARDRKRDRDAQSAGYVMLRYTGSEIYRDPLGCARSAIKALADVIRDDWLKDL